MNLVLDFGNSRIKTGLFDNDRLLKEESFPSVEALVSFNWSGHKIDHCLLASVTSDHLLWMESVKRSMRPDVFGPHTPLPVKNLYKSPQTLGSDRLLSAIGAGTLFPKTDLLTIDAGTCIKYNFLNRDNEFLGGAISPGIPMRLKAMHEFTHALPLPELPESYSQLIGDDTRTSLLSGAITAAVCEVDEMIRRYQQHYANLKIVVTGGDAPYLCKQMKSPFFANQNTVLLGLNAVLLNSFDK